LVRSCKWRSFVGWKISRDVIDKKSWPFVVRACISVVSTTYRHLDALTSQLHLLWIWIIALRQPIFHYEDESPNCLGPHVEVVKHHGLTQPMCTRLTRQRNSMTQPGSLHQQQTFMCSYSCEQGGTASSRRSIILSNRHVATFVALRPNFLFLMMNSSGQVVKEQLLWSAIGVPQRLLTACGAPEWIP
jgi:hypothetical protein